jgi:hypothetical protein
MTFLKIHIAVPDRLMDSLRLQFVCVCERERQTDRKTAREIGLQPLLHQQAYHGIFTEISTNLECFTSLIQIVWKH